MKALTLRQPWASLLLTPAKRLETRAWPTAYRGRLAIHAARAFHQEEREAFERLRGLWRRTGCPDEPPFACVLGTVELIDCLPVESETIVNILGLEPDQRMTGDFTRDRWAWVTERPRAFDKPIPARGMLGLWEWKGATP